MRSDWNLPRLMLAAATLATLTGCAGINASYDVSPASFFLPGLVQNTPPLPGAPAPDQPPAPPPVLAQAR